MNTPDEILTIDQFFSNKKPLSQNLLRNAICVDEVPAYREGITNYRYLNEPKGDRRQKLTHIVLAKANNKFTASATGRLYVKQEISFSDDIEIPEISPPPPPVEEQK